MSTSFSFLQWRKNHICSCEFSSFSLHTQLEGFVSLVCFYQCKICLLNDPISLIISNFKLLQRQAWKGIRPTPLCKFPSMTFSKHTRSQGLISLLASNSWRSQNFQTLFYERSVYFPFRTWKCRGETEGSSRHQPEGINTSQKARQCWPETSLWKWSSETPFYQGHTTTVDFAHQALWYCNGRHQGEKKIK